MDQIKEIKEKNSKRQEIQKIIKDTIFDLIYAMDYKHQTYNLLLDHKIWDATVFSLTRSHQQLQMISSSISFLLEIKV